MFSARLASKSSTLARLTAQRFSRSHLPAGAAPAVNFHASVPREDETAAPATSKRHHKGEDAVVVEEPKKGWWDPIYSIPLGVVAAVPVLHYEWYLVNEETQLMACFMMFTALIYRNFGQMLFDYLEADGKRTIEEQNRVEDEIIGVLQEKLEDIQMQSRIVEDAQDIYQLKLETYDKLNAAGKHKPLYDFKTQMERLLNLVAQEEATIRERAKHTLMEEATVSVTKEFSTSAELKKQSLTNAIAVLKGTRSTAADPVKEAYLKFFKTKAAEASKVDAKQEVAQARSAIVTKLNSVAKTEKFYFQFDKNGAPKMVV